METLRCDHCGYYGGMVFVHSHYMCPRCKNYTPPPFEEDESTWLFGVADPEEGEREGGSETEDEACAAKTDGPLVSSQVAQALPSGLSLLSLQLRGHSHQNPRADRGNTQKQQAGGTNP